MLPHFTRLALFTKDRDAIARGTAWTISQSYVVALMLEAARIGHADHVLKSGVGSGFVAVMSRIARKVRAIERHDELVEPSRGRIERSALAAVTSEWVASSAPVPAPRNWTVRKTGGNWRREVIPSQG